MATSVTILDVVTLPSGRMYVHFADGSQWEFNDLNHLKQVLSETDRDVDLVKRLSIGNWLGKDPNASNVSLAKKTVTLDLTAANILRIQ